MNNLVNLRAILGVKNYLIIFISALLFSCEAKENITLKPQADAMIGTSWAKLLGYDVNTGKGYYEIFMFASETEVYLVRADDTKKYNGPIVKCTFKRVGNVISINGKNVHQQGQIDDSVMFLENGDYQLVSI